MYSHFLSTIRRGKVKRNIGIFLLSNVVSILVIGGAYLCAGVSVSAQKSAPLFRYVFSKTGREVYAAKPEHRKIQDGKVKSGDIVTLLGYVYIEKAPDTYPLFGLKKLVLGTPALVRFTIDAKEYEDLVGTKSGESGKWEPYYEDTPIVGFVRTMAGNKLLGAYHFTQPGVEDDQPRIRIEGKELKQWKALKGVKFNGAPSFYIWKDKPVIETIIPIITPVINIPKGVFLDQSVRPALYENGKNGYAIDATRAFAGPGKPLVLSAKDALSCTPDGCKFNLGWFVMRNKNEGTLSTYATVSSSLKIIGNSIVFKPGERSRSMVFGVPLKYGSNTLTVSIKPYKTGDDIDKSNNSFTVEIVLNP